MNYERLSVYVVLGAPQNNFFYKRKSRVYIIYTSKKGKITFLIDPKYQHSAHKIIIILLY